MIRLAKKFEEEVVPALTKQFGYSSRMAVPKVAKVVVNMGVGEAVADPKLLDQAVEELGLIVAQRPAIRRARKSIANFKLREGMPIGCTTTLRGRRMYEFLDRLLSLAECFQTPRQIVACSVVPGALVVAEHQVFEVHLCLLGFAHIVE